MFFRRVIYRNLLRVCACGVALLLARPVSAETLTEAIQRELHAIRESRAVEAMHEVWDFENGCLTEDATKSDLCAAQEHIEALHECGVKEDLEKMADAALAEMTKPETESLGVFVLSAYCNCSACCGKWAGGATASGTIPTAGRTVASDLPFGTRLLINGHEYVVEDRGVSGNWIDIYMNSHSEACAFGLQEAEVFIIK